MHKEILIAPARGVNPYLSKQLISAYKLKIDEENNDKNGNTDRIKGVKKTKSSLAKDGYSFSHIRDLYPRFEYEDIASHPAIVIIPYQVRYSTYGIVQYSTCSTVQYIVIRHYNIVQCSL